MTDRLQKIIDRVLTILCSLTLLRIMNSLTNVTAGQLRQAANLKEKIDELLRQLDRLLGGSAPAAAGPARRKRKISADGRARITTAARARWDKLKEKRGA